MLRPLLPESGISLRPPASPSAGGEGHWLVPSGQQSEILELVSGYESPPLFLRTIDVNQGTITIHVANEAEIDYAKVRLEHAPDSSQTQPVVRTERLRELADVEAAALQRWTAQIEQRSTGDIWIYREAAAPWDGNFSGPGYSRTTPLEAALSTIPIVHLLTFLLALGTCAAVLRRSEAITIGLNIKITHALPATLQTILFSYWFAHWPEGRVLAPLLVVQILYAYVFDLLFSLLRRRRWELGLGPVPVVLSTNLFAQYLGTSFWCALLAVAVGLAAKTWVTRGGRHIFNPSVIGLSCVALLDLALPEIGSPDFSHEFDSPPNMTELILMLALIVQLRLPVVLVTLGAALGSMATNQFVPDAAFSPVWAPVTLVLCLLITDPATIPRSNKGKFAFGAFIGAGMIIGHNLLIMAGHSDFWAKVACVPLANLLVPVFDRFAASVPELPGMDQRYAKLHVAMWLLLAVTLLAQFKMDTFVVGDPSEFPSPCYVATGPRNDCDKNPMYCRMFSFDAELGCLIEKLRSNGS